jgi:hypothetical protein
MVFPGEFDRTGDPEDVVRERMAAGVKAWFPDKYTAATGEAVRPEESLILRERAEKKDEAAFRARHRDEYVESQVGGDSHNSHMYAWIPDGYAVIAAKREADGDERRFLVPKSEAIRGGGYVSTLVIDPARNIDVTDVWNLKPATSWPARPDDGPKVHELGISYAGMTAATQARARRELEKMWRFTDPDGSRHVESLADHMARVGVVGKAVNGFGNKTGASYTVRYGGGSITKVSKATFDALAGVPDVTTDLERAGVEVENTRLRLERAQRDQHSSLFAADRQKAAEKVADAKAAHDAARQRKRQLDAEQTAAMGAWQDEQLAMRQAAMSALLAGRGSAAA